MAMKLWVIILALHVSHHSPSTYMFYVLSKMKPVAKIKYLIAILLSKHISQLLATIWWSAGKLWVPSQRGTG